MNKLYKTVLSVSAATVVATASLTPAFVQAWGDSANGRPSYTNEQINEGVLGDTITFNSISDSKIGDEKNFVAAKVSGATVSTWNADAINVEDGKTYTIRLFVHNNSPKGTDAIAEGVRAWFNLPTTVSKEHTIVGYLSSTSKDVTPDRYWDEVVLKSDEDFYIEYVENSAQFNNKSQDGKERSFKLPNEVITAAGAQLGYDSMNGQIPGCYEYSGVVTIDVKVHKARVNTRLATTVRMKGSGAKFGESVDAKVGDEVEYQIEYVNLSADQVNNVMIRDILPTNVEYVQDSTVLYNSNYKNGMKVAENTVTTSGINIGSYKENGNAYVRFTGKVVDKTLACGSNQLVNWASATVDGKVFKDDASVMLTKTGGTCDIKPASTDPTPTPAPAQDNPSQTPTTIVNTGASTVVMGALGAGSVVTALGYFIASRKKNA